MELLGEVLHPADWHHGAACATHEPELWWADSDRPRAQAVAIDICRACPVQRDCLEHALAVPEREGIWGGLLPYQRKRLAVHRREQAVA